MEKVKLLIDKYGLPENVAKNIDTEIQIYKLLKQESKGFRECDNPKAVERIKNAEPIQLLTKHESFEVLETIPLIKKIQFKINTKYVCIDDPYLIEKIRQCVFSNVSIENQKFISVNGKWSKAKRPRGNQKDSPILKQLAVELMQYGTGTPYNKRVFVGDIFSVYLDEFLNLTNKDKQKEINNILNRKD